MSKLSKLFTVVFFLSCSLAMAQEKCEEIKIGQYEKSLWENSLFEGLKGEFVNQLAKNDDLFENLSPELKIDLTPEIEAELTFSRKVDNQLPIPTNQTIGPEDYFKYKVKNDLRLEMEGRYNTGIFFASGLAGVHLVHATDRFPNEEISKCDIYKSIVNKSIQKGQDFIQAVCEKRDKHVLAVYYEKLINFLSQKTGAVFNFFADSEKNKIYAEDPLAPMKLHSLLGIPLDHTIFFENNSDIAIGDVVEHTSYYGIKPFGVQYDLFQFMRPSVSKYYRFFRTLSFKKLYGNKVLVEIEDTALSGRDTELMKINPRILGIIKVNLGKWNRQKFDRESLRQRFEIDLKSEKGVDFFKKVLFSAYTPSVRLGKNSILVDYSDYSDEIKVYEPVYTNGYGKEAKFVVKIPGAFSFDNRSSENVERVSIDEETYIQGEKLHRRKFRNKIELDLKLFKIQKADRNYECHMAIESSTQGNSSAALNFKCNYYNKYATTEHVQDVKEAITMALNGDMMQTDYNELEQINYSGRKRLSMSTQISFSDYELNRIKSHSEEYVYAEISKMLFGDDSKNIFHPKYHKVWRRIKSDRNSSAVYRSSRFFRDCSKVLYGYSITEEKEDLYKEFNGIVGKEKGIKPFKTGLCYNYFRMAKRLNKAVDYIKNNFDQKIDIEEFFDIYRGINYAGLIQNLLVRLAGGVGENGVHYSYIVASEELENTMIRINGLPYSANIPQQEISISDSIQNIDFPRLKEISFFYNECHEERIKVALEVQYPIEMEKGIMLSFDIKQFSLDRDLDLSKTAVYLTPEMSSDEHMMNFEFDLQLPENYDWEKSHNMYIKLINDQNFSLSRETKSFIQSKELFLRRLEERI